MPYLIVISDRVTKIVSVSHSTSQVINLGVLRVNLFLPVSLTSRVERGV